MHTCSQWQMLCCRRWDEFVMVFCWCDECNCYMLRCLRQPSASSVIIFLRGSAFHNNSKYRRWKNLREKGKQNNESSVVCFSVSTHMSGSAALRFNVWVKKFQELKYSMPQSHDLHLTPSLPFLLYLHFPAFPWVITICALVEFF